MALKIEEYDTIKELREKIRYTKDGRYQLRLNTIVLAKKGVSSKIIQTELMISSKTYYKWIHSYNTGGTEALENIRITGRKDGNPKWDNEIFEKLFLKLDAMQEYWNIPKMQKWIKETYNKDIPYSTVEYRLHKSSYSYKSNRPSPYKGDKEKQESFKKMASKMWQKD